MKINAGTVNRRKFVAIGTGAAIASKMGVLGAMAQGTPIPTTFQEAPMLADLVAAGSLPALADRLPPEPLVIQPLNEIGAYGGVLRGSHTNPGAFEGWMVVTDSGLLSLGRDFQTIEPCLASGWQLSDDGLVLTLNIRQGVKWSDGEAFSADDIMFWWNDVVMNTDLTPALPPFWAPGGSPMQVAKVDESTITWTFAAPYFKIVENMATNAGVGPCVYPKHYLTPYHATYADPTELAAKIKEAGVDTWDQLFVQHATPGGLQSYFLTTAPPDYPTLSPMVLKSNDGANVVLERNPYFWKVDPSGNQLPYIDGMNYRLVQDAEALKLKVLGGEVDFEGLQGILKDYPLYRDNEETGGYKTLLWNSNFSGNVCLMFNQTSPDEAKRTIFQDVRFRQAMSLGLDRDEINQVLYLGQAAMQQATANASTSFYVEEQATAYLAFDPDQANALLDEMGMAELDGDGYRKQANGDSFNVNFEFWSGQGMGAAAELVADQWRTSVKIKVTPKAIERALWEQRVKSSEHELTCWVADKMSEIYYPTLPNWLVARDGIESAFGVKWVQWFDSDGVDGEEPPDAVKSQREIYEKMQTVSKAEAIELGKQLGQSQAENLWTIGTAATSPMPIIASARLGNVPEEQPFYGNDWMFTVITRPETWYFTS
ncbi:MAG: ABC transporter substrate-binding protein [Thermomicrobiales bacterium]